MNANQRWMVFGGLLAVALVAAAGVAAAHGFARGGSFRQVGDAVSGKHLNFSVDASGATITSLDPVAANAPHPLVSSIRLALPEGASATGAAHRGAFVVDDARGNRLVVEDSPRGGFAASSANGTTVTITLPEGASVAKHDAVARWSPAGATITYANGAVAQLVIGPNGTIAQDGQVLTVTLPAGGHAAFGLAPPHHGPRFAGYIRGPFVS